MVTEGRLVSSEEHEALMDGASVPVGPIYGRSRATGAVEPEVREYDFLNPHKFTREIMRLLMAQHVTLAEILMGNVGGFLRAPIAVGLAELQQQSYQSYVDATVDGYFVYSVSAEPFPRSLLIAVNADVAYASIDRMQGGVGKRLAEPRPATEMEQELLAKYVMPLILDSIRDSWAEVERLSMRILASDSSATYLRIALPSDACLVANYSVSMGNAEGMIMVCYPFALVEPALLIMERANTPPSAIVRRAPGDDANVRRSLGNIQIPLVVELGAAVVSFGDVLNLQVGDVVPLTSRVDGDIKVLVNGAPKYSGRPGLRGKTLAVRVTGIAVDDDDEEGDPAPSV